MEVCFEAVLLEFVRSGAEGVCFDDVSAGAYVFSVNFANEIGIAEIQFIVTTIDVDAFGIKHRAHRAVEDVDAISFEKFFKGCIAANRNEKSPALNNAGLQNPFEVFRVLCFRLPELFSWLFYVAASRLNSPRLPSLLIRPAPGLSSLARGVWRVACVVST